ncbi:phospholipase A2 [Nonomuraea sp. NPDC050643]|uniref:phospholipase A2 n=1 Tax=Nonomuraea sp. NPDC050643 TaxID=3155660 RepID=UPI0033FEF267
MSHAHERRTSVRVRVLALVTSLIALLTAISALPAEAAAAQAGLIGESQFVPVTPAPLLDTRSGNGAAAPGKLPARGSVTFQVTGRAAIPATEVSAVALKIEAVAPERFGWLTVYPSDAPTTNATVTFSAKENTAGADHTRITSTGKITITNNSDAPVHVLVDVRGYFREAATVAGGTEYHPLPTAYLYDTRPGHGLGTETKAPIPAKGSLTFQVAGVSGMPATGATAVALNLVAANQKTTGWLSVRASDRPDPMVSTVAYVPGEHNGNLEIAQLTSTGKLTIANHNDTTVDVSVTVRGYFKATGESGGAQYKPVATRTIVQTLDGTGILEPEGAVEPLAAGQSLTFDAAGAAGVLAGHVQAVAMNVGARRPTQNGWLSVHPAGGVDPGVSSVNYGKDGDTTNGLDLAIPDTDGFVTITNHGSAAVHVQVSVRGYYLTPSNAALILDQAQAEPGDQLTLTAAGLPSGVTSVQVASPVIEGGTATLTRPAPGEEPVGRATLLGGTLPGVYPLTGAVGTATITAQVEVTGPATIDPVTKAPSFAAADVDAAGTMLTRTHLAASPAIDRPDQGVLGAGWRPEALGGIAASRLDDHGADGFIEVTDQDGDTVRYTRGADGVYTAGESATLTVDAAGTITERPVAGLTLTWSRVAGHWLVTAVATAEAGSSAVVYDQQGRVGRVVTPGETAEGAVPAACGPDPGPGCASITLTYAGGTTATAGVPGDYEGRLKSIAYSADAGTAPFTAATYTYATDGRLAEVTSTPGDGTEQRVESYGYDQAGRLARLASSERGTWTFGYAADGTLTRQDKARLVVAAAARCRYASQYMWGRDYCWARNSTVKYKGKWRRVGWRKTPTGFGVVGITHDHCTSSIDRPAGFNFIPACDMHDYGRSLIQNKYLPKSKKGSVDAVFYTTLRDKTCPAYGGYFGGRCKKIAWTYYKMVRKFG